MNSVPSEATVSRFRVRKGCDFDGAFAELVKYVIEMAEVEKVNLKILKKIFCTLADGKTPSRTTLNRDSGKLYVNGKLYENTAKVRGQANSFTLFLMINTAMLG